jgi:RNA-binding protein
MRRLGKVIHLTNRGLVVRAEEVPDLGGAVYDKAGARVGSVLDLFGPVAAPYAVIKPARGLTQAGLGELIGKDLHMGEQYGKTRKAKRMPGVRKRKTRA